MSHLHRIASVGWPTVSVLRDEQYGLQFHPASVRLMCTCPLGSLFRGLNFRGMKHCSGKNPVRNPRSCVSLHLYDTSFPSREVNDVTS
jgi:hypothetical protein